MAAAASEEKPTSISDRKIDQACYEADEEVRHILKRPTSPWMAPKTYEAIFPQNTDEVARPSKQLACSSSGSEKTPSPDHQYLEFDGSGPIKTVRDAYLFANKGSKLVIGKVHFWHDGKPESIDLRGHPLDVIMKMAQLIDDDTFSRLIYPSVNVLHHQQSNSAGASELKSNRILEAPNRRIIYVQENVKAMTYNLNRFWAADLPHKLREFRKELADWTDEKLSVFHWNNRVGRIAKAIAANKPSIVALQELRWMETSNFSSLLTQPGMEEYRFEEFVGNGTKLCMTSGCLYDITKWFCVGKGGFWLSDTPDVPSDLQESNGFGRYVGYLDLLPIKNEVVEYHQFPLRVYVVHLSVFTEELKWLQLKILRKQVNLRTRYPYQPFLIMGDFNFFDDLEGKKMRAYMSECYTNLGADAVFSQSNEKARCTFVPYSYDSLCDRQQPVDSIPDHIFSSASTILPQEPTVVDTRTYFDQEVAELSDNDLLPSDHMSMTTTFSIRWFG